MWPTLRRLRMPPSVTLTREEGFLCTLLDDACRWMQTTNPSVDVDGASRTYADLSHRPTATTPCEARIAGGWVRDKLLGLPSHDLDVSLSSMTGHHFALFLKAYLESEVFPRTPLAREMQEAAPSHARISHIGKIAANPEQSKNLETATARVLGFDLDFVNLRKEVYEGTHRIPIMSFGTPLEDAMRRDMTVNALFYNVHTAAIEDWTQHGLADLRDGIVRTPMDPTATFTDDPLRILRCVRFGSRFGYAIHPDILAALAAPASPLHAALASKVSRERVGIEVDKMLSGRDPRYALQLLAQLQLYWVVFMPPPALSQRMGRSSDHGAHIDELVHDAPDERAALGTELLDLARGHGLGVFEAVVLLAFRDSPVSLDEVAAEISRGPRVFAPGGADAETEAVLRHFSGALLHGLIARGHGLAAAGTGPDWADAVRTVFPAAPTAPDASGTSPTGRDAE